MNSFRSAKRKIARRAGAGDSLNLVPMIDIFTVLVSFLLMTAVFDPTSVLQLDLPAPSSSAQPLPPGLQLEITVRAKRLEVGDRDGGILKSLPNTPDGYDIPALSNFLKRVKAEFPDKTEATVLLEPDVPYDSMVQVMDAVRSAEQMQDGRLVEGELFVNISIGDAPK